jgi:hypothetical protein
MQNTQQKYAYKICLDFRHYFVYAKKKKKKKKKWFMVLDIFALYIKSTCGRKTYKLKGHKIVF